MAVQALTQVDPKQFFNLPSTSGIGTQRLDTQVSGVALSNDLAGRLSVTTAEGDKITLTANLESDFRSVNYTSHAEANGGTVDIEAKYAELSVRQEFGVTVEGDLNEQEVKDLAKLLQKVSNIFKKYFSGQDEEALAKTAKLADRFGNFSSLAGLDLSVDVERSMTVIAAQLAAESNAPTGATAALPTTPATNPNTEPTQLATPGVAPSTAAAIPSPSSGTTAPTHPSASTAATGTPEDVHLTAPAMEDQKRKSLVEQVLDAVKDSQVKSHKLRWHLPRLLDKVREELQKELRGETEQQQTPDVPMQTATTAFLTYQSTRQTSMTLSIHT